MVVALVVKFLLEFVVSQVGRQIVILSPAVEAAADLFDSELSRVVFVEALANATAQEEAQAGYEVVAVDAAPAADFKVIHPQFLFADPQFCFNADFRSPI